MNAYRLVAPATMRRLTMHNSALQGASRQHFKFDFPHSFLGANNAFNNVPQKKVEYALISFVTGSL